MSEALQNTIDRLPEILQRNAKSMMQRMVDSMQRAIAADPQLGASSYCALLLKMSSNDLVREFDRALGESTSALQQTSGVPGAPALDQWLTIEPLDASTAFSETDFLVSTALFEKLCAKARGLGVDGLGAYGKELFLTALDEAFGKARMDTAEAEKILPFAARALNRELEKLYGKLDSLCGQP